MLTEREEDNMKDGTRNLIIAIGVVVAMVAEVAGVGYTMLVEHSINSNIGGAAAHLSNITAAKPINETALIGALLDNSSVSAKIEIIGLRYSTNYNGTSNDSSNLTANSILIFTNASKK